MSANDLRKKSRKAMNRPHTRPVKVGRFIVTSHAQNRLVDRDYTAECMIENLCRKPMANTPARIDAKGWSYHRLGSKMTTAIDPTNKNVMTIFQTKRKEAKKYGFTPDRNVEKESQRRKRLAEEAALKRKIKKRATTAKRHSSKSKKTASRKKR